MYLFRPILFHQKLLRLNPPLLGFQSSREFFIYCYLYGKRICNNNIVLSPRRFYVSESHISENVSPKFCQKNPIGSQSTYIINNIDGILDSSKNGVESQSYYKDGIHRRTKLSKKTIKNIRSIERMYKPPNNDIEDNLDSTFTVDVEVPLLRDVKMSQTGESYENVKKLVKEIYKSSSDRVYNDSLWNRYSQKLAVASSLLHPSDIVLCLHSFSKIRYKDNNILKVLIPLMIKNVGIISPRGISLMLNSLKRLEVSNYDLIEILSNEFCLNIDKANVQDIALVANSLSFFEIYHVKFWNLLYNSLLIRHHQIDPLQASLILASLAKLDIRNPLMLRILKRRLRPALENNQLPPEMISLVFHSLAKLDFDAKYFYDSCVNSFDHFLTEDSSKIDSQSHVLFLYTSVCMLHPRLSVVEKSLKLLSYKSEHLKSYKMIKLKYVLDHLKYKYKGFLEDLDDDIKKFLKEIETFRVKKIPKKLSRWAFEVSMILKESGVEHKKSVLFDYLYADVYLKDHNYVIKCTGPYSYYTRSSLPTKFSRIEHETFSMKGFNIGTIPYYEWNRLKTNEDKIEYLKKFGENAALTIS